MPRYCNIKYIKIQDEIVCIHKMLGRLYVYSSEYTSNIHTIEDYLANNEQLNYLLNLYNIENPYDIVIQEAHSLATIEYFDELTMLRDEIKAIVRKDISENFTSTYQNFSISFCSS